MTTHTPGPWRVSPEKLYKGQHVAGRRASIVSNATGAKVCDLVTMDDAALIVAAPELLQVLQVMSDWFDDSGGKQLPDAHALPFEDDQVTMIGAIKAALDKAQGVTR